MMKRLSSNSLLIALAIAALTPLQSQVSAEFFDINPNSSSLDPVSPNGASGGRVNGLGAAADGSAFYAASEWGGIYKSADKGRTWELLRSHLPMATWDVEVDPSNPSKVYATSFFDGRVNSLAGINVSTDAGRTWARPATTVAPIPPFTTRFRRQEPSAFGISIDAANPKNVYIGTNTGLAISNDAGATWRFVDPTPTTPATNILDVVVHHGGIIDVVGDDGHCRSTDGGATWVAPGTLVTGKGSIAASPDEPYVLFAVMGVFLFQTTDAGVTWLPMVNPNPQGRIPFVATNKRGDKSYDLWFGDTGLWRVRCTTPASPAIGGPGRAANPLIWSSSFTSAAGAHDDSGDILFDPLVASNGCPVLFASDGGVYYNTRTGSDCHSPAWEQPKVTPHALWPFGMSGTPTAGKEPEQVYFGNQDNGTFGTFNAGAKSPAWINKNCCDGFDFVSDNARVLYTVCCFPPPKLPPPTPHQRNQLYISSPGLTGGVQVNTYPPGNLNGFAFDDIIDQFSPSSYAVVTTSGLYLTSNIAATPIAWSAKLGGASSPATLCNVKASKNGATPVFYSFSTFNNCLDLDPKPKQLWRFTGTDPVGAWQQVIPPDGKGGFGVYDVDPNNSNRIIASHLRPPLSPQMVFSSDGGATWRVMTNLNNLMTANGVFYAQTALGPSNFTDFQGYTQPSFVAFDPTEPCLVVAGAIDAGVFVSVDGGTQWTLVTDPIKPHLSNVPHLPRPRFAYFSHQPDAAGKKVVDVYVGTQGRGVWRMELTAEAFCGSGSSETMDWTVDMVPQLTVLTAWDAAAAMMAAWLPPPAVVNVQQIEKKTGYWAQFQYNLDPTTPAFFSNWGLKNEGLKEFTFDEVKALLLQGPIIAASGNKNNRVRVIFKIAGDGTEAGSVLVFHDPLDKEKKKFVAPNKGFTDQQTFQELLKDINGDKTEKKLIIAKY